jgi:hypothetical protein
MSSSKQNPAAEAHNCTMVKKQGIRTKLVPMVAVFQRKEVTVISALRFLIAGSLECKGIK